MPNILTYLLIGTLFILILDIMGWYLNAKPRFSNLERFVVILFWPISLLVFLTHYFKK
jgi:hypothetical protein